MRIKTDEAIAKINSCTGNVTAAAKQLGVTRNGLDRFINAHPSVKEALQTARESMIDNVESRLYQQALEGEAWAVCFFLKTQAKHRGYTERQEVTGANGEEITLRVVYGNPDKHA